MPRGSLSTGSVADNLFILYHRMRWQSRHKDFFLPAAPPGRSMERPGTGLGTVSEENLKGLFRRGYEVIDKNNSIGGLEENGIGNLDDLKKKVHKALKHSRTKLAKQQADAEETRKAQLYTHVADTILADPSVYPKGTTECVINDVHTGQDQEVKLNPKFDGVGNAQLLYKKARKARRGTEIVSRKVDDTVGEIRSLEKVKVLIEKIQGGELEPAQRDISLLRSEAERLEAGQSGGRPEKAGAAKPSVPYRHFVADGVDIFIGKNDEQNDELSVRFAKPWDVWMHVVAHPGSHVVVRREKNKPWPKQEVLSKAASLAVWFSRARHTGSSEVHMTEGRFVRKRRKAPPGEVIAERCKSIRVAPKSPQELFPESREYSSG